MQVHLELCIELNGMDRLVMYPSSLFVDVNEQKHESASIYLETKLKKADYCSW